MRWQTLLLVCVLMRGIFCLAAVLLLLLLLHLAEPPKILHLKYTAHSLLICVTTRYTTRLACVTTGYTTRPASKPVDLVHNHATQLTRFKTDRQ